MSIKEKITASPFLKKLVLWILFRPKPNSARVRWMIGLFTITPHYFRRGINWGARLDLVPFHRFKIGKDSRLEKGVVVNNGVGDVIIGNEVHTGIGSIILGPVTFHDHANIAQYVRVLGMHHGLDADRPHQEQGVFPAPIVLEEDAFVGTGTVILGKKDGSTLTIGKYARVGANAVVADDVPPYSVAVGNPAKVVRVWDHETGGWKKPEAGNDR